MSNPPLSSGLPLSGVRVLDITLVWAGPYSTMLLADLGAEVIRVESTKFWQTSTRGAMARPTQEYLDRLGPTKGGYPDGVPGERPWNRTFSFNATARNKLSTTINLQTEEGKDLFKQLVAKSDALVENNAAGVMDRLGLGYDVLSAINPKFIMIRSCGMGQTGPYKHFHGFGSHFEDILGHTWLRGYPDSDPSTTSSSLFSDAAAGAGIAFSLMAALHHRNRTGEGQFVDMSQAENIIPLLVQPFMEYSMSGELPTLWGNRNPEAAPQGCYPALGEDRWLTLTIATDEQFRALCGIMGRADLAADPGLQTLEGRHARHDELDEAIASWTRGRDQHEMFHTLQAAGIAAAPVQDEAQLFIDPQLTAREFYQPVETRDSGRRYYHRPLWLSSPSMGGIRRGPVALGQDNEYVYQELLQVPQEQWDRLVATGEIGEEPDPKLIP
ncbi:MAG: CoA transferase [Chloroflexi bacterium]|nr:CoA transferase [Chloroflexota bacterium]